MSGPDYDLAIVGSGFGGALLAQVMRRQGRSVLLLEAGKHPRFAIGESTSPLTNLLLEQIAARYGLARLLPLAQWGTWQESYPEIRCGLKRGFTFYHHRPGEPFRAAPDRSDQLLVAASPHDYVADTHWYRADFDHFLVREAIAVGADYEDEVRLTTADFDPGGATLSGEQRGRSFRVRARFVVDAGGPRGFLSRALGLEEVGFAGYPPTQALFSHFTDVARCEDLSAFTAADGGETPPYPPDDAALHHVFADGGWMWVLRFAHGVTSAGVAVTDRLAGELGLGEGAAAWPRLLERYPSLREHLGDARPVEPFRHMPRLAYRCAAAAGPGWALLPSAAAFIDPLFSTGFPLTLLGIERLARLLEHTWDAEDRDAKVAEYGRITLAEAEGAARFIAGFYGAMPDFAAFVPLSMFYFAAASFSEMARRLEKTHLVTRLLAQDHPTFWPGFLRGASLAGEVAGDGAGASPALLKAVVTESVAPLNIAGLADPVKRNWYGVDLSDLVKNAEKLEMSPAAMREVIATAPWAA